MILRKYFFSKIFRNIPRRVWLKNSIGKYVYIDDLSHFRDPCKGSRKKVIFFSGQSTKALALPPPRLSGQKNGYKFKKKTLTKCSFFLSWQPLPPFPLLVDCPPKKITFFAASPKPRHHFFWRHWKNLSPPCSVDLYIECVNCQSIILHLWKKERRAEN